MWPKGTVLIFGFLMKYITWSNPQTQLTLTPNRLEVLLRLICLFGFKLYEYDTLSEEAEVKKRKKQHVDIFTKQSV